jgi:hypothetical protein
MVAATLSLVTPAIRNHIIGTLPAELGSMLRGTDNSFYKHRHTEHLQSLHLILITANAIVAVSTEIHTHTHTLLMYHFSIVIEIKNRHRNFLFNLLILFSSPLHHRPALPPEDAG